MAKFKGAVKLCMSCGREFRVPPTRAISAKYCSNTCANLHRNDGKIKEKVEKKCPSCGKVFFTYPSHDDRRVFCSYGCKNYHKSKNKISLSCQQCGKTFTVKPSLSDRKYCSLECKGLAHTENYSGENCHAWKGGISQDLKGYIREKQPMHPFADSRGYVLSHLLVMENWLKQNQPNSPYLIKLGDNVYLSPDFIVHHKNGIVTDNRIENLQVMTNAEHTTHHNLKNNI